MEQPKVSIIIAFFSDKYIDFNWDSIKKQTYKNWEVIFVIDDSEDARDWFIDKQLSKEIEGHDVWSIDIGKNQGRYGLVARNLGILCATGKYIQFLDDDNEFVEDDYLETMVHVSEKTKKVPYSNLYLVGKKPGSTYTRHKRTHLNRQGIDLGNPLYKRSFFDKEKYGLLSDKCNAVMFDWDKIHEIKEGEGGDESFIHVNKELLFRHKRY